MPLTRYVEERTHYGLTSGSQTQREVVRGVSTTPGSLEPWSDLDAALEPFPVRGRYEEFGSGGPERGVETYPSRSGRLAQRIRPPTGVRPFPQPAPRRRTAPPSCPPPGAHPLPCRDVSKLALRGKQLADYLRTRTEEDPLFAVLSGVFHSGPIMYQGQQLAVEWLSENKDVALDLAKQDVDTIERFFRDPPADLPSVQHPRSRANMYPGAIDCYENLCGPDGKECLETDTSERLVQCMVANARGPPSEGLRRGGIGPKTADLIREYLGNKRAVAVDRHVFRYLCSHGLFVPRDPETGEPYPECCEHFRKESGYNIPQDIFSQAKDSFLESADACGVVPTDLQVGVWFAGVCDSETRHGNAVYLGRDGYFPCVKTLPLEHFAEEQPAIPESAFTSDDEFLYDV